MNTTTTPAEPRRSSTATHTLTNPHGDVWILATARGQIIRAITAAGIDDAAALAGPLGDETRHQWLRRGPGRYSRRAVVDTADPGA